jgi:hypothetical protein
VQAACATSGRGRSAKLAVAARQLPRVQAVQVATSRCGNSMRARLTLPRPRGTVLRAVSTEAMAEDATEAMIEDYAELEDEDEFMSFSEVSVTDFLPLSIVCCCRTRAPATTSAPRLCCAQLSRVAPAGEVYDAHEGRGLLTGSAE